MGICLAGNFDKENPTQKQIDQLVKYLIEKCKLYKLDETTIYAHCDSDSIKISAVSQ